MSLLVILWILCLFLIDANLPQVQTNALIDLYNSTGYFQIHDCTTWLHIDPCDNSVWLGCVCDGNRLNVIGIDLSSNQLNGTIPSSIGSLPYLQDLDLSSNQLSGTIPSTIGSLLDLQNLYLFSNQLSGTIPSSIGSFFALQNLILSENQLSGTIPYTIGSLSYLRNLYLDSNQLSGTIPSSIGFLSYLQDLYLSRNQLSGTIPSSIGSLLDLHNLYLSRNQLSGTIPSTMGLIRRIGDLDLTHNKFCGGCYPFSPEEGPDKCNVTGIQFNCSCPYQPPINCTPNFVCEVPIPTPTPTPTPTFSSTIIIIITLSIVALITIITFVFSYVRHFLRGYDLIPYSPLQDSFDTLPGVLNGPLFNRYVLNDDEIEKNVSEPLQTLAPLILLQNNEQPCSFKESLAVAYGADFNELFVDSNIQYGTKIYSSLCSSEKDFKMTLEEVLAIYFFTLEWFDPTLNLYSRLNRDLTSINHQVSATKWRFYVYFLFEGLRKIPYWKGSQDLYRAVTLDLVTKYPQTYLQGNEITWFGVTSTTTNVEYCKQFIQNNTELTIFSINSTFSGRSISKFSSIPNECEVLLPPGSHFKILGILPIGDSPVNYIQLKQIPTLEKSLRLED